MKKWVFLLVIAAFAGCNRNREQQVEVDFESLENTVTNFKDKQALVDFFAAHPTMRDVFFTREAYPNDSVFIEALYQKFTHPSFDTLHMEANRVFGDGTALRGQFARAFTNIKSAYPNFVAPKIQTVISGFENDVVLTDSVIVIGLDFFLGAGAKYKPNLYDYMLRRYNKDFVAPSVMLLLGISDKYNKVSEADNTALAEMVAYGKAYAFASYAMETTPDSVLIGYTAPEWDGVVFNEAKIWSKLVDNQVLYATGHMIKQKYIGERPTTAEISAQCPGRIGMWVGWQIVKKYQDETGKSLPELMGNPDAQAIFKEARYKPR